MVTPTGKIAIRRRDVGRAPQATRFPGEDVTPMHPEQPAATARVTEHDGAVVLAVTGEVDLATSAEIAEAADEAHRRATESPRRLLVVDLASVVFLASVGVGMLADHRNRAEVSGVTLVVVASMPAVTRVLTIVGLDEVIPVHASLADALAANQPRPSAPQPS